MPDGLLASLVGGGASVWIYSKMMHRTGGNTKGSLTVAAVVGIFAAVIVLTLLKTVFKDPSAQIIN